MKNKTSIYFHNPSSLKTIKKVITTCSYDDVRQPLLSEEDMRMRCNLGLDSWANTGCFGKHAYIEEFGIRKRAKVTGFSSSLGTLDNLPYVYVLFAYNHKEGSVTLF